MEGIAGSLGQFLDVMIHIDKHLEFVVREYGQLAYALLFAIIFIETGLVLIPFLPGDSLLFLAGTLAASGLIDPYLLSALLVIAAVSGNTVNYWVGAWVGPKVYEKNYRFLDRQALLKTQAFYEKHGGKTIVLSRFAPIFRTFAPFVAGVSAMNWRYFQFYNITGALLWIVGLIAAGYSFGHLPIIRDHLSTIVLVGLGAAIVPVLLGLLIKFIQSTRPQRDS